MTVRDIVLEYLRSHYYDGLFFDEMDCDCILCDLMPCGGAIVGCRPGVKVLHDDGDWHVEAEPKEREEHP